MKILYFYLATLNNSTFLLKAVGRDEIDEEDYWSSFYKFPDSAESIFNLCAHKEIRGALEKHPENVGLLLQKVH